MKDKKFKNLKKETESYQKVEKSPLLMYKWNKHMNMSILPKSNIEIQGNSHQNSRKKFHRTLKKNSQLHMEKKKQNKTKHRIDKIFLNNNNKNNNNNNNKTSGGINICNFKLYSRKIVIKICTLRV